MAASNWKAFLAAILALQTAYPATLNGSIMVNGRGPLADAIVRVDLPGGQRSIATKTTHNGTFSIEGVDADRVLLTVKRDGEVLYQSVVRDIKPSTNITINLDTAPENTRPANKPAPQAADTLDERTYLQISVPQLAPYVYAYIGEYHHQGSLTETRLYIVASKAPLDHSSGLKEKEFLAYVHDSAADIATQFPFKKQGDSQRFTYNGKTYTITITKKLRDKRQVAFSIVAS